jgi:hypothetical protein
MTSEDNKLTQTFREAIRALSCIACDWKTNHNHDHAIETLKQTIQSLELAIDMLSPKVYIVARQNQESAIEIVFWQTECHDVDVIEFIEANINLFTLSDYPRLYVGYMSVSKLRKVIVDNIILKELNMQKCTQYFFSCIVLSTVKRIKERLANNDDVCSLSRLLSREINFCLNG